MRRRARGWRRDRVVVVEKDETIIILYQDEQACQAEKGVLEQKFKKQMELQRKKQQQEECLARRL